MNLNKELEVNMVNGDLLELEMYLGGILINGGVTGIGVDYEVTRLGQLYYGVYCRTTKEFAGTIKCKYNIPNDLIDLEDAVNMCDELIFNILINYEKQLAENPKIDEINSKDEPYLKHRRDFNERLFHFKVENGAYDKPKVRRHELYI